MKKSTAKTPANADALALLIAEVRSLIQSARNAAASTINTLQVMTNYEIGRRIVEHEQKGEKRAEYGAQLIKELSKQLSSEFGRGFSTSNLASMKSFYLLWHQRVEIFQSPIGKLESMPIFQSLNEKLTDSPIQQSPTVTFKNPFTLSWTHYLVLLPIKDPDERRFYEIEATNEGWSVSELKRQKAACLFERRARLLGGQVSNRASRDGGTCIVLKLKPRQFGLRK
jgi:hypothetical protein